MDQHLVDGLAEVLDRVREAWPSGGVDGAASGDLRAVNDALGAARRRLDALAARVSAEVARQSRPELGKDRFARKQGFRSPTAMISATTGSTGGDAAKLIRVGEGTAPRTSLTGEPMPAKHPHVAATLEVGAIGVSIASIIIQKLDQLAVRVPADRLDDAERFLAEQASRVPHDQVAALIARVEAHLDPDGVAPREDEQHTNRAVRMREDHRTGMFRLTADLDPESAAYVRTALTALVSASRRKGAAGGGEAGSLCACGNAAEACACGEACDTCVCGKAGDESIDDPDATGSDDSDGADGSAGSTGGDGTSVDPEAVAEDDRSLPQRQADALVDLCKHVLGCGQAPIAHSTTTVVVRIDYDALVDATGHGTIDGLAQPVSAVTVRRMAAQGGAIPCVLGSDGVVLDWGRRRRLFSYAQKLAIAERDDGCAMCGARPELCQVHHIRWWERDAGPTDLDNGIMLCTGCHGRVHGDGWTIRIDGRGTSARVWFIPPDWLDHDRTPRPSWSLRYTLAA